MGDSWCSTISVEWWSFTVGVHDLLYAWVELRGRHSASTCSEYLLSDGGSGKNIWHNRSSLQTAKVKPNVKNNKASTAATVFAFHFWSLMIFLMLLWSPMNAAGAPLLYYDLLIKQPAFNQRIGHLHPTTCGWNFGRLHGSTFVEGENPFLHAVPTKTWTQMDHKLHSGVLGGTKSTLWLPLEGKLGVIRAYIPSKAEGKEKKKE